MMEKLKRFQVVAFDAYEAKGGPYDVIAECETVAELLIELHATQGYDTVEILDMEERRWLPDEEVSQLIIESGQAAIDQFHKAEAAFRDVFNPNPFHFMTMFGGVGKPEPVPSLENHPKLWRGFHP